MSITYIKLAFVGANVLPIFFLNDTFHSRYAKKPINESNDSDDSLEPKCGSLGWRPGPGNISKNHAKTSPLMTSPTEYPKHRLKICFFNRNSKTCRIH